MNRFERLHSFTIMSIILLSVSYFFTELIPRPFDWLIYLVWLSLALFMMIFPLVIQYKDNLGFFFFALGTILLLPLALSNCGIIHHTFSGFIDYETAFDWSMKSIIAILYLISFVLLYKRFKNN